MERQEDGGFELLDEAQHGKAAGQGWRRRELIIGLALALVVLAWGVWDWQHQQYGYTHYQQGKNFAAQSDWDNAEAEFAAAGDYSDAPLLAADAAKRIDERNRLYSATKEESLAQNWLPALRDVRALQEIQPGYKDSLRINGLAQEAVYSQALDGAVVSRPDAKPPGLYIHNTYGWVWLPRSDAASTVRGYGDSCCVVYDAPTTTADARQAPLIETNWTAAPPQAGARRVVVARLHDGTADVTQLALDPNEYTRFVWDDKGVVGERFAPGMSGAYQTMFRLVTDFANSAFDYNAFNSTSFVMHALTDSDWATLDANLSSHQAIIADYSQADNERPQTTLYLLDIASHDRRLLFTRPSVVTAARLSPDKRFLLISEYAPQFASPLDYEIQKLIDLSDNQEFELASKVYGPPSVAPVGEFSGEFISSGPLTGYLLQFSNGLPSSAKLIDPANPTRVIWSGQSLPYDTNATHGYYIPTPAGLLVGFEINALGPHNVYFINSAGSATSLSLALKPQERFATAWTANGSVVYAASDIRLSSDDPTQFIIRSQPIAAAGTAITETEVLSDTTAQESSFDLGSTWYGGPGLLAYSKNNQLRVRSYDGAVDLQLEQGGVVFYRREP